MLALLLLGLFLAGICVTMLTRAAAASRGRAVETLGQIKAYGYAGSQSSAKPRGSVRDSFDGIASLVGSVFAGRARSFQEEEIRAELVAAGLYSLPPKRFMGYRVISAVCVPALWIWIVTSGGSPAFLAVVGFAFTAFLGWRGPLIIVRSRAKRRSQQIDFELPELIDLLVVTVEAGLGFNGSLQIASERLPGAIGQELRLTLQEQNLGLSTNEALRNLLARCDTPAMRSFVRSILQGETLGVSIGQIMRNLALEMRKRRRAAAEERAQKAPVKLLFPLVLFIFPAIFVILLGPAVFTFAEAFGGK